MTTVAIQDRRSLTLSTEAVLDAIVEFDRKRGGTLASATIVGTELRDAPSPTFLVTIRARGLGSVEERRFDMTQLAAAIINYCAAVSIPLPRHGTKMIEVSSEGLTFTIDAAVEVRRLHPSSSAAGTARSIRT